MATKKKVTTKSKSATAIYRLKGDAKLNAIVEKYPAFAKPLVALASAFEMVEPNDARPVSGYVQARIASFCKERMDERVEFNKQQRQIRLTSQAAKYREKLQGRILDGRRQEHAWSKEELNEELGIA